MLYCRSTSERCLRARDDHKSKCSAFQSQQGELELSAILSWL